jgi:signal transduction histidine kinase
MEHWPKKLPHAMRTGAMALFGALILIAATVLVVFYQERSYREQKLREVSAQADVLADSVAAALVFDDAKAAQEYVSALRDYPDLDVAAVYDSGGRLFSGITRSASVQVPRHSGANGAHYESDQVFVTKQVVQNGSKVGQVYLQVTIDSGLRRFLRYLGIIFLVTMAVLMLSVLGIMQQALTHTNTKLKEEMSERARIEDALRQSQKMEALGQLAGGIAHDFNNLLAIIKGSIQLMQRRLGTAQADVQRFIDAALDGVDRAALVTQRVLAFSRRQTLSQMPANLSELVENILPLIRQSLGSRIQVETRLRSDWMTICDVNQMESVIINLAINARDAMPDGGVLSIETANVHLDGILQAAQAGDYIRFDMRDTGTGMSEDVRLRAFDPFFTTKAPGKGTGLGLSMALGFVNQSNGHLLIESEPGKGTTITILMPRLASESSTQVNNVAH